MISLPSRFFWSAHHNRGIVRRGGQGLDFTASELPHMDGLPDGLTAVDYWPEGPNSDRGLLREGSDREREMTADELAVCRALVAQMTTRRMLVWLATAARAALKLKEHP